MKRRRREISDHLSLLQRKQVKCENESKKEMKRKAEGMMGQQKRKPENTIAAMFKRVKAQTISAPPKGNRSEGSAAVSSKATDDAPDARKDDGNVKAIPGHPEDIPQAGHKQYSDGNVVIQPESRVGHPMCSQATDTDCPSKKPSGVKCVMHK